MKQLLFGTNQLATFSRMCVLNLPDKERNATILKSYIFLDANEIRTLNVKYDFVHYS